jgi:hypothetical protein
MKPVALALLMMALVAQATACGGGNDDDDSSDAADDLTGDTPDDSDEASDETSDEVVDDVVDDASDDVSDGEFVLDVNWQWLEVAAAGTTTAATCPPNTDISVHTQQVDASGNPVGQEIIDIYNCEDGGGILPPVPASTVSVYLSGEGGAGDFTSFTQFVDLTTMDQVVDFDLIANGGYIQFAWELVGGTSNTPLSCEQVTDLTGIGAIVTVADTPSEAFDFQYTCQDGFGTTDALAAEDYVISIDAFSDEGSISEQPFVQNVTVGAPNDIVEIGTVEIPIEGL